MPCSRSFCSRKATNCGLVIAFNSTRRVDRSSPKSRNIKCDLLFARAVLPKIGLKRRPVTLGVVLVFALQVHRRDVVETEPEIDRRDVVLEFIAARITLKRPGNREAAF